MQTIYQYLLGTLLPATLENEIQGGSMPRHASTPFAPMHYGRFLTGPSNLKTNAFAGKPPKVYLGRDSNRAVYYLIVYRALNSTLCLFLNGCNDDKSN